MFRWLWFILLSILYVSIAFPQDESPTPPVVEKQKPPSPEDEKNRMKRLETMIIKASENAGAFIADVHIMKMQFNKMYELEGQIKVSRSLQKALLHLKKYQLHMRSESKEIKEGEEMPPQAENETPEFKREDIKQEWRIYLDTNGFEIIKTDFPSKKTDFSNIGDFDEIMPLYLMLFGFDQRINKLFEVCIEYFGDEWAAFEPSLEKELQPGFGLHDPENPPVTFENSPPWIQRLLKAYPQLLMTREEWKKYREETIELIKKHIEEQKKLFEKMKNTVSVSLHPKVKEIAEIVSHIHGIFNMETFAVEAYSIVYANGDTLIMEVKNINRNVELKEEDFKQEVK